ncbi:MAG: sulfurtransferase TusA family protein [Acidimicrobiia bacterium]|nr:sulfurtransferase TusA family protein [Acidimicrobiia bacterium]MBT8207071.1 sulfurtransferase TusA family protein [Acidimicrobiia bacterium]MBT8213698.1 sulfurtransferase TusA family protein [Acidimicrobiia bacterium]NNF70521.1 sulfurtransferase TusA family protein [Acidimicrobiia bacterium]NNL48355.1 sulfurtransferase TusA family protein [Acidimicrobiia bacterium]
MPVLKIATAMNEVSPGDTIELIATDRGALSDIPAWAKDMGHSLKEQFEADGEYHFVVEKS